jgi:hypothetical protein
LKSLMECQAGLRRKVFMSTQRWKAHRSRTPVRLGAVLAVTVIAGSVALGVAVAAPGDYAATLAAENPVPGTPCSSTADACVDLAAHTAWLIQSGRVVHGPVPFMDGDVANPTPRGTFIVEWKAEHWTSREYGTPMPYSVFFAPGGIAFHEGRQDAASAGCVKLRPKDAKDWFSHLQVGDEVQVR